MKSRRETGFVEGWIRGTKYHDQQIVLTSHIQEEATSANDDASGMGNMLEMARVFTKLIREGKMERPLARHPLLVGGRDLLRVPVLQGSSRGAEDMLANINQDMVGAKQSIGDRIQRLIYNPHSRTSYLDTLLESIGTYVIQSQHVLPFRSPGPALAHRQQKGDLLDAGNPRGISTRCSFPISTPPITGSSWRASSEFPPSA